jgi:hypothetical protein
MKQQQIASFQRLVEYDETSANITQPAKLTVALDAVFQDTITRIGILHDISKTEVIKQAISMLVDMIGEDVLYPPVVCTSTRSGGSL